MNNSFALRCAAFFAAGFSSTAGFPSSIFDPTGRIILSLIGTGILAAHAHPGHPLNEKTWYQLSALAGGLCAEAFRESLNALGYDRTSNNLLCFGTAAMGMVSAQDLIARAEAIAPR